MGRAGRARLVEVEVEVEVQVDHLKSARQTRVRQRPMRMATKQARVVFQSP